MRGPDASAHPSLFVCRGHGDVFIGLVDRSACGRIKDSAVDSPSDDSFGDDLYPDRTETTSEPFSFGVNQRLATRRDGPRGPWIDDEVVDDQGCVGVGSEVSEVPPVLAAVRVDVPADLHNALLAIDVEAGRDDAGPPLRLAVACRSMRCSLR